MKSSLIVLAAAYLFPGVLSICESGTTKNKLDVTAKVFSEDNQGVAWIENTYQSCMNYPCIVSNTGSCPKYWGYKYTLKTGNINTAGAVSGTTAWQSSIPGQVTGIQYLKQTNYVILTTTDPDNALMSPKTLLVRPDGRTRTLVDSFDTSKINAGDPFNVPKADVYASPSGRYYAIGRLPGNGNNRQLVLTVHDACTGNVLVSQTVDGFKPNIDFGGIFRWVSDNSISYPESQIFSSSSEVRVGTWVFDIAGKKTVSNTFSTAADSTKVCYGSSTTSNLISRDGYELLAKTASGTVSNVDAGTAWSFAVAPYDPSIVKQSVFNCALTNSRGSPDFPNPNIKCNCGAATTSYTTNCKFFWSSGCASGESQVSKSSCSLGWWDFASTGSRYSCSKSNGLNSCTVTSGATGAGFSEDANTSGLTTDNTGRAAGAVTVDVIMGLVIGCAIIAVVVGAIIIRKKFNLATSSARV